MNIFDPHITGSLSVSSSAQISGDLTVLGTIYGAAEITGEVTNAISASYAPSYVLTSSFEIYTASLDDTFATDSDVSALRGTLNTYTSSNNTTNTTQNGRLSSIEVKTGSLDTSISTINTLNTTQNNRLNSIEATTGSINLFTSSIETRVDDLETFSSSLDSTFATDSDVTTLRTNFNTYTSSNDTTNSTQNSRLGSLETKTGSLDSTNTTQNSRIGSLETKTGSLETTNTTQNGRLTSLETKTGSLETTNTTQNSRLQSIENATSSLDGRLDTIELGLEFTGSNLTIKGNLLVKGIQTTVNSTTVSIEDNIISLNGSGAANGGIEVRDVTSPGILSGSLIWDGLNNQWKGGTKSNEERLLTNTDLVGLDGRLDSIESFTASIDDTYATDADVNTLRTSLNTYTSSNDATNTTQNGRLTSLEVKTGSLDSTNTTQNTRLSSLETKTGSLDTSISTINTLNTTQNGRLTSLETKTGSLETTNTTQNGRLGSLETKSGSVDTSISNINTKLSGIDVTTGSLDSRIGVIEDAITNLDDTYATDSDITTLRGELNTYASSNNTTNTTQNGRLGSLETESGSIRSTLNSYTSSNNTTIGNIAGDLLLKGNRLDSIEQFTASIDDTFATDSDVTTLRGDLNTYTSSNNTTNTTQNSRLGSLETKTGSLDTSISTINTLNTTQNTRLSSLETKTGSLETTNTTQNGRLSSLETESGSVRSTLNTYTSSNDTTNTTQNSRLGSLETKTGSLDSTNSTQNSRISSLEVKTGSLDGTNTTQNGRLTSLETKTGSLDTTNTTQNGRLDSIETYTSSLKDAVEVTGSNVTIKGNLLVKGTETRVNSTTVEVSDNVISLNGSGAANGGIEVRDVTSPGVLSGSLIWDGLTNKWKGGTKGNEDNLVLEGGFNTYTSSNNATNTTQNNRLGSLETSTSSLNSFTSSINTTIKSKMNTEGVISGSLQINHDLTTNFSVNEHIDHSSVSIGSGKGLEGGGTIDTNRSLSLHTGSLHFLGGVKSKLNTETVVSGSIQIDITGTTNYNLVDGRLDSLETESGSVDGRLDTIESQTGSYQDGYNYSQVGHLPLSGGTMTGATKRGDDVISYYGTGDDLRIYNNSTNGSNIWNTVGHLTIQNTANGQDIRFFSDDGLGGNAEYFRVDGGSVATIFSKPISLSDGVKANFGTSDDLQIYHDGTHNYIDGITNDLYIRTVSPGDDVVVQAYDDLFLYTNNGLDAIIARGGAAVELYHNNSKKFETTSTGISVTGVIGASGGDSTNWNTAYGWGNHASAGYLTLHPSVSAAISSNNSGRTYIQDILLDVFGHITGITTATETVVNTDTNYYVTGATFSTSTGIITITKNDGSTVTVDIDGKYAESTHTHTFASITSKPTTLSGYGITDAATSAQGTKADSAFGWGNHASAGYANYSHKYHTFSAGDEYYDSYGQNNNLRLFTENATFDNFRFRSYSNVEYFDGTNWVAWGQSLDTLFDGREETGISLGHANSHFRFEINRSSGWPTTALFVIQSSWTDTNSHTCEVTLETWNGSAWVQKDNWTYSDFQRGINLHTTTNVHDGNAQMRVTINMDWVDASHNYYPIRRILLLSNFSGTAYDMQPFTWDYGKNVTFASQIYVSGGNSSQWNTAYGWGNHSGLYLGINSKAADSNLLDGIDSSSFLRSNVVDATVTGTILSTNNANVDGANFEVNTTNKSVNEYAYKVSRSGGVVGGIYIDGRGEFPSLTAGGANITSTTVSNWNTAYGWGNHAGLYSLVSHTHTFASLTSKPTTLVGYGITDAATSTQGTKADSAYGWGNHASAGYLTAHPSVTAAGSSNNSGRTYIQDILLDGFGHITGITTATETVVNTDTNYYTTGSTFNSTNGIATFTRNDGGTYTLNLLSTLSDVTVTGGTYNSGNQTLTLTKSDGNTVSVSGFAIDTDVNWYTTGATFNTGNGIITGTRNDGGTWTVDIDGRYLTSVTNISGYSGTLLAQDNRTISPSELSANLMKFGFTSWDNNNSSPYADFLHLRSYADTSGGADNLIMFKKSGIGMRIWQQTYGSATAYSSYEDVWTTGGITTTQVSNWDTAYSWGNHASAGYLTTHPTISGVSSNNSGRTYIQDILTDSNGHITGITTATETVVNTDTNYYTTGSTFNTTNGIITFTRNDGGTYTVDIDGKYAEASHTHSYVPLAGGTMSGNLELAANTLNFADNGKARFGNSTDLQIYHNPSIGSIISDSGPGDLFIETNQAIKFRKTGTSELMTEMVPDGAVNLYYDNSKKFETTSTGVTVTGVIGATGGSSTDWNTAFGWGNHASAGYLTLHPTIAGASSNNSGRTYIQDILTDGNGHVTGITTASETVVNTDTNYYVSSAAFNTSDGVLTLSRNGLSAVTVDLDGRYQATGTYLGAINYNNDSNANYQLLWGSGNAVYGTAGVYLNPSTDYVYGASFNASDWFRSSGNTGWYNSTYSGGWYMTDSSYIRPYNGKSLSMDNGSIDYVTQLHFNDNVRFYDEGNNQYLNYKWGNSGAGGIKFVDGDNTLQGYVYGSGTGSFGLLDSGSNWKVRVDSSNVEMYGTQYLTTVYANFIYDRDNTAYYLNPAGGSNLNTLTLNSTTAGSTVLNVQGTQGQLFSVTDDLTGDLFSVSDASGVPIFNVNANGTVSIDALGSLTIGGNPALTAHPSVTAAGSSNNSGRTYIQDILLDAFGHITGITTATETVVNTDTNTVTSVGIAGDLSTGNITLVGSGSTTVTKSGGTITITSTDTNTTYSVGDGGLTQFNFTTAFRDKLNGIEASANNYVHPTTTGNKHIPTGGSSGQILRWSADGTASWGSDVDTNTTYTAGTGLTLTGTVFSVTAGTYAAASHTHTFASLTSKPTTISGYGITDAITTGNIGSQSVDYATRSKWIDFPDGPRDLSDRRPDWNNRSVAWDFVTAATVGGSGNYAGVMTFSPWDGTAASTGDSSYQLAFHNQTGVNSSGAPGLKIRNGIDATWKSWRKVALVNTVTFSNVTSVTFEHGLGTDNVVVQVYDGGGDLFFPSAIRSSGGNVSVVFEIARSGRVVVTG